MPILYVNDFVSCLFLSFFHFFLRHVVLQLFLLSMIIRIMRYVFRVCMTTGTFVVTASVLCVRFSFVVFFSFACVCLTALLSCTRSLRGCTISVPFYQIYKMRHLVLIFCPSFSMQVPTPCPTTT